MSAKETFNQALAALAVTCLIVLTGITVKDRLIGPGVPDPAKLELTPIPNWSRYISTGQRMGPAGAPITVLEFGDFECPVCRSFTLGPLRAVRREFPNQVAVVFRNWPLAYHRFALPAARAAQCAADQGRFEAYHDLLYRKQDSLGLKTFTSYARESGVSDTVQFARCLIAKNSTATIGPDTEAALSIGGTGTPTIVVNGERLSRAPDSAEFVGIIKKALNSPGIH